MKHVTFNGKTKCEDCGFYQDCPIDYLCPAAEILKFITDEQNNGRIRILFRNDLIKEIGMDEEE